MAKCDVCGKRGLFLKLHRRLAIPERRAMIGFWPWLWKKVCDECLSEYDRAFLQRLKLLAPDVVADDEPVSQPLCLSCGTVEPNGQWQRASKWVDARGQATRRAQFLLCPRCAGKVYFDEIIAGTNLKDARAMQSLLAELPRASDDLLKRIEGWALSEPNSRPADARDFCDGLDVVAAAARAFEFWTSDAEDTLAKAAMLGPRRQDYKLHYRLDLLRDTKPPAPRGTPLASLRFSSRDLIRGRGRVEAAHRQCLCVIRTPDEKFTVYQI